MGIDALVFCDCLETGSLRKAPRPEWQVYVQADGCRDSASSEHHHQAAFGHWHETACVHDYGILMHRRLEMAALLQPCLQTLHDLSPVLRRILSLSGEEPKCLDVAEVKRLAVELQQWRSSAPADVLPLLDELDALAATALRVGKPLAF